ncbi:hypothetical protein NCCP2222_34750 [Sporosarcina sp. NCCP-2222]|uniref:hypothetical protein n=1 Tax=Sporosarcina sp. NCCP-2222 TaxID=2935073 RepID=UPI002085D4EA|nr:hypothetical protein [Sporosarcina sp. NCCP-2222]GKV57528.1 hypothetical protein NCCP2222_34750 [Sporosarcina sp. NCCP-2222]
MLKRSVIVGLAAILVLLVGCEKEEQADADTNADLMEKEMVEEAEKVETAADEYWSQAIDSELCQTIRECRDLGDEYGSEFFYDFIGGLNASNRMSNINAYTEEDKSVLATNTWVEEVPIVARYELREDEFFLTEGEEESMFTGIADLVLDIFNRNRINVKMVDFQEDIYMHVNTYEDKLYIPSNLVKQWLQSYTLPILVHEYGHLVSWNEADFVISDTCPAEQFYYKPYGGECYNPDSYMNHFFQSYWKNYEEQWLQGGYVSVEDRIAFYEEQKESFITIYASVNPYEDIAESFKFFMLTPYNNDPQTVADEKVNFFYQFPELVEYRTFVIKTLKDRKDEMLSFW